ncbi:MAG: DUF3857 domain-containing protein [Bacteroidales bacterium]|nr:DUF3857 domain-containing protein [Bacteroidales bacterium]
MKKVAIVLFTAIIVCFSVHSQESFSLAFGKISEAEATMTSYEADPEANALILYEVGKTSFVQNDERTSSFNAHMYKRSRIKIFNEEGLEYGNISIPYYTSGNQTEKIQDLKAITYNYENGNLVETALNLNQISEEMLTYHWKEKKFTMPNIKPGSIIELEYTIVSPFIIYIRDWKFQHYIPVLYSGFEIRLVPFFEYAYIVRGKNEFDEFTSTVLTEEQTFGNLTYKEVKYYMGMQHIPAFKDEKFITSPFDYMTRLTLQLSKVNYPNARGKEMMTTWPEMCNMFLKEEYFGKYINSAEKAAKNILPELNLDNKSPEEKIRIITEYVKQTYT